MAYHLRRAAGVAADAQSNGAPFRAAPGIVRKAEGGDDAGTYAVLYPFGLGDKESARTLYDNDAVDPS
jgi:hypothetical protein